MHVYTSPNPLNDPKNEPLKNGSVTRLENLRIMKEFHALDPLLRGSGDLVSRLITPIDNVIILVIPLINLVTN